MRMHPGDIAIVDPRNEDDPIATERAGRRVILKVFVRTMASCDLWRTNDLETGERVTFRDRDLQPVEVEVNG